MPNPLRKRKRITEKQLTFAAQNHILTNINVWSPDGDWIVYDTRPDQEGAVFEGQHIEMVNTQNGEVRVLFNSTSGAFCGVATWNSRRSEVIFILGPQDPTPDWQYGPAHRQGVIVQAERPCIKTNLDARDISAATPGALRGGSHVHVWNAEGDWASFTYNDHLLAQWDEDTREHGSDQRNIGVSVPGAVRVNKMHPRNHDGEYFSVLVTRTKSNPRPGSDEIKRAFEESWIETNGYKRADGTRQKHALAFQGEVVTAKGQSLSEVFIVDLPNEAAAMKTPSDGPLQGTLTTRPAPPSGVQQRRLTHTENRPYPGLQGPRHWLRSAPDGSQIGFLMRDEQGVVQLWSVSPNGGAPRQITRDDWSLASAFSWSANGRFVAYVADNSVFVVEIETQRSYRLTPRSAESPLALACVFSPDGRHIAFLRSVATGKDGARYNQIFVVNFDECN